MNVMLSIKANKTENQEQGHLAMQARGEAHLKLAQTIRGTATIRNKSTNKIINHLN
ncbi:hypothetical protein [Salinimonas sediminis]|uniref:hypothetical protein n=1 Tax=Salinimonas sediminis TaxID=2303538 RepID=UPI001473A307|nr:hypothetical protein [Salinimonas sediminis]